MSVFGTSRFTALIAAVALSGTAGTFWWALETRSDLKAAAGNRAVSRGLPAKAGGRVLHSRDERPGRLEASKVEPNKFEPNKYEVMGRSERTQPGPAGRNEEVEQAAIRLSAPRLASDPGPNYPNPGQGPGSKSGSADMPLPTMLAKPDSAPVRWQAKAPDPPLLVPPIPTPAISAPASPPPVEIPKRQMRETRAEPPAAMAAARSPRPPAPSFYTEQFIEQGEFRYRRRPCEPPNMPDVCFMPQADRHPIVVAKP